jgi:hypothetical protein
MAKTTRLSEPGAEEEVKWRAILDLVDRETETVMRDLMGPDGVNEARWVDTDINTLWRCANDGAAALHEQEEAIERIGYRLLLASRGPDLDGLRAALRAWLRPTPPTDIERLIWPSTTQQPDQGA